MLLSDDTEETLAITQPPPHEGPFARLPGIVTLAAQLVDLDGDIPKPPVHSGAPAQRPPLPLWPALPPPRSPSFNFHVIPGKKSTAFVPLQRIHTSPPQMLAQLPEA